MKKISSNLFKKLKDSEISSNTSVIIGGDSNPGSNKTGDMECTNVRGVADCTDQYTDYILDTTQTAPSEDGCQGIQP